MKPKIVELAQVSQTRPGVYLGDREVLLAGLPALLAIALAAHELELEHASPVIDVTMRKLCRERLFAANAQLDWSSE